MQMLRFLLGDFTMEPVQIVPILLSEYCHDEIDNQSEKQSEMYLELLDELKRKEQEITDLRIRVERLETVNDDLIEQQVYTHQLITNKRGLSSTQKIIMLVVKEMLERARTMFGERKEISIKGIAKTTGISEDMVGAAIRDLDAYGALDRDETTISKGRGKVQKRVSAGLTLLSYKPSEIQPIEPREHGGTRIKGQGRKCVYCGSERVDTYRANVCCDCGETHYEETSVNRSHLVIQATCRPSEGDKTPF